MKIKQDKYINKTGYTLLEIMVVVMIIGILATIAITSIIKVRENMRLKRAETELEMIAAAVRQLAWDTGKWPSGLTRLDTDTEVEDLTTSDAGLLNNDKDLFKNWNGPYLATIPDDPWGTKYFFDPDYKVDGVMRIVLGSYGPNRTGKNKYYEDNLYVIIE